MTPISSLESILSSVFVTLFWFAKPALILNVIEDFFSIWVVSLDFFRLNMIAITSLNLVLFYGALEFRNHMPWLQYINSYLGEPNKG